MNVPSALRLVMRGIILVAIPSGAALLAQTPTKVARIAMEPARVTMRVGERVPIKVIAYDAQGNVITDPDVFVYARGMGVFYDNGVVEAARAGSYTLRASWRDVAPPFPTVAFEIPVTVSWPPLTRLAITGDSAGAYTGVILSHSARGWHADGTEREGLTPSWRSSDSSIASIDRYGTLVTRKPGTVTITAESDGARATRRYTVRANPVSRVEIGVTEASVRTGDVVLLSGRARRANGSVVADVPITWSYSYVPDDSIRGHGGAAVIQYGRFAANHPGRYMLYANAGGARGVHMLTVTPRDVVQPVTVTSRGPITETHTADLWPWTGKDGRDYVIVGKYGIGMAQIFDITDLSNITRTDSIAVDARVVNDVTISPDARYGVIAREGASNRVNGVVILDLATPAHPKIASTVTENLTGGVHNVFATDDYLFAISGGQKYVIIDVRDITKPKVVGEYRHPNSFVHDLWVRDGIAYSAQSDGIAIVDVGNGKYGGSPEKPKLITYVKVGNGHEIYPYFQKSTGKTYLFTGNEEGRSTRAWRTAYWTGRGLTSEPRGSVAMGGMMGGYTHIVDVTDLKNPKFVAKYHIEDYGTHDIIVEDDKLYQAYYDGGVRVVDVSGELLGNLAEQGREIAVFKPFDPQGYMANSPMVMNAMPWKGHVLFTDFNSGLWAVKLEPKKVVP